MCASRFNLIRPEDDKTKAEKDRKPMQIKLTFTLEYELILPLRVRPGNTITESKVKNGT